MHVRRIYRSHNYILFSEGNSSTERVGVLLGWSIKRVREKKEKENRLLDESYLFSLPFPPFFYFLFRAPCLYLPQPSTFYIICLYTVCKLLLYVAI